VLAVSADEEMMSELLRWAAEGYGDDKRKHEKKQSNLAKGCTCTHASVILVRQSGDRPRRICSWHWGLIG